MRSSGKLEWIPLVVRPGAANNDPQTPILVTNSQLATFRTPLYLCFDAAVGGPSGHNPELTFKRIVGQIWLKRVVTGIVGVPKVWTVRFVAPIPFDLTTGIAYPTPNMSEPAEFESHARPEVMWQRFYFLGRPITQVTEIDAAYGYSYLGSAGYPSSVVDCRVQRRLHSGEGLYMEVQQVSDATDESVEVFCYLKALVDPNP